ncbi:MAG: hypothetical protein H0T91_04010 [Propionibacteriaceae bacterium]|nr:hypothetical protein [Propionibacteriaceae bacterium]
MTEIPDSQQELKAEAIGILITTAEPATGGLAPSTVPIEWIDAVRDWARNQAAAAPPLTAEAARLISRALAASTSPEDVSSANGLERPVDADANPDQSRRTG